MAKPALGKGLSALIPAKQKAPVAPIPANTVNSVLDLKIESIKPNEYQPRRIFRDEALNDLVSSIKEKGVIQPIIVRKDTGSSYELIAGERRWRASQLAGLKTIPAIVIDAVPIEALELAIIENIQREDLNPLETAEAFQRLVDEFALTHDELSKKVGKDRATVSNYLRILKLTPEVKKSIAAGTLTMGHAKALLQAPNERLQQEIAQKVIRNGLSVRE
nr:ParB/RepB/Spo0J family partition protein [bacterium]